MNEQQLRKIIGLAGIPKDEAFPIKLTARYFKVLMIVVAIWLPLQLYLEHKHALSIDLIRLSTWLIWLAFFAETFTLFIIVKSKRRYLLGNWLNLIIIVGAFPLLWEHHTPVIAILRWIQALLVLRLLIPVWDVNLAILSRNHLGSTLIVAFIITVLWGVLMSVIDPGVHTPWDGIWLAWETATTVGYGDIIPQTAIGRILTGLLMLMGLALISLLTANFSAYFIHKGIFVRTASGEVKKLLGEIQEQLNHIEQRLDSIQSQLAVSNKIPKDSSSKS